MKKLGIIAGRGDLVKTAIDACRDQNREYFILAVENQTDSELIKDSPHAWVKIAQVGDIMQKLHQAQVKDLMMVGAFKRPSLLSLKPDARGMKIIGKIGMKALGDDGLLKILIDEFAAEGFNVVGVDSILPEVLAPEKILTKAQPDEQARIDIEKGISVLQKLSDEDIGQAVVIQQGLVLGIEAIEGTGQLLDRICGLQREGLGGVLVKMRKTNQDNRVDLPTIGPETIAKAQQAGLRGIAVEAGGAIILRLEETKKAANDAGLFLCGIKSHG
jgi:DUF1009 family protein